MQSALLLIALGFGFKIFAEASEKQKKSIKQLGRLVGIIIMVISLCGVLCSVFTCMKGAGCGSMSVGYCPVHKSSQCAKGDGRTWMKKDKAMCPLMMDSKDNSSSEILDKKGG